MVAGGLEGGFTSGLPVIAESAVRPRSVSSYLLGLPKKSTLNSMKPRDVSCLITQSVVHSELLLMASSNSALLSPSLLFAKADRAPTRWGEAATFLSTDLWPFGSEGHTQTPSGMENGADCLRLINPAT
jgi:hypothetical protein